MMPNVGCSFTRTDKLFILKISPLLPHSQHNSLTTPPPPSHIVKQKRHFKADQTLSSQVSSFLQTCNLEALINQLAVLEVMTFFTVFSRMACFLHKISGNPAHMVLIQAVLAFSAVLRHFPLVLFDPWWLLALALQCCTPSCSMMEDGHGGAGEAQGGSGEVEGRPAQEWRGDPLFPESTLSSHKESFIERPLYASRHEG